MLLTSEQLLQKIQRVIKGYRHKYYENNVSKAVFYRQLVTGQGQEELIVQYKERETDKQKQQRIKLTHTRTKSAANKVSAMFDRVFEVEKLNGRIDFADQNDDRLNLLLDRTDQFKGRKSLEKYLNDATLYYNFIDPNAFLLIGYTATTAEDGQILDNPTSFPIEIPSRIAVDYEYVQHELQYLITEEQTHQAGIKIREYYGYSKGLQIYVVEVNEELSETGYYPPEPDAVIEYHDAVWAIYETEVTTEDVPAMQWGYLPDYRTNRQTFVSILDSADQEFLDLINRKSEYDISLALHTFLQKFQIAEPCENQDGNDVCIGGTMSVSRSTCSACNGSGLQSHTTAQQVMLVRRGETKEENIPLRDMAHYLEMPFEIVEHQSKIVEQLPREISVVIFGVDITERPTQNVTATAISNYFESLYAVLAKFADQYSELFMFSVRTIAEGAAISDGLIVDHKFPRDFDLLTLGELLAMLDAAKKAGAPDEVISNIEQDILAKQNQSSPIHLQIFKAKRKFRPFKNIPEALVINTLSSLPNTDSLKIQYLYNDIIFDRIMQENPEFVKMSRAKQQELVDAQTNLIRQTLLDSSATTLRSAIISDVEEEEEEEI